MNNTLTIKNRILNVLPAASLEMLEFFRLFDVRYSTEINSAAVTCDIRPVLLLNKDFVDEYCQSDEHLFMLVMHELYHIILGHTALFKMHSEIDNIAFDAIINSILCKSFPGEAYTSFFTSINSDSSFPSLLLRPKGEHTPKEFSGILKVLYESNEGTYYEVYQTIIKKMKKEWNGRFVLLGNHTDGDAVNDSFLQKQIDKMMEKWPRVMTVRSKDMGDEIKNEKIDEFITEQKLINKMKSLLKKAGVFMEGYTFGVSHYGSYSSSSFTYIPNYRDRMKIAKDTLLGKNLLYKNELKCQKYTRDNPMQTYIYLDVSGSVYDELRKIFPLLFKPYKNKLCRLFTFSTQVDEISYQDLTNGKYITTGGTDINCVFNHYFAQNKKDRAHKVLILTDGCVGKLSPESERRIHESKLKIYVGLFADCTNEYMKSYVKEFKEF